MWGSDNTVYNSTACLTLVIFLPRLGICLVLPCRFLAAVCPAFSVLSLCGLVCLAFSLSHVWSCLDQRLTFREEILRQRLNGRTPAIETEGVIRQLYACMAFDVRQLAKDPMSRTSQENEGK
jgi:hypothetical protein